MGKGECTLQKGVCSRYFPVSLDAVGIWFRNGKSGGAGVTEVIEFVQGQESLNKTLMSLLVKFAACCWNHIQTSYPKELN